MDNSKSIKTTWSIINSLINPIQKNNTKISVLDIHGKEIKDETIANKFNEHFIQVGSKLANNIFSPNTSFNDYLKNSNYYSLFLSPITCSEVIKTIDNFSPKISKDELDISMKLIKLISSTIAEPLTYIFNLSFSTGTFPNLFKKSKVIPIYKSGNKNDFNNYRPICLNIQFSKILEKLFFSRLLSFCDFHNIISSSQFGFRKGLNTLHAIETLQKAIIDSLISNKYCVGLFIDLKKAFDTVNHEILLKKLDFYGIRGLPLSWLSSYLKDRSQFTNYNNCMSTTTNIDTELSKATKSIQNGKAVGLDEIPAEVWKIDDFQEFLLESCNCVYNQESIRRWREGCILPFPKKGNLSITKNYRGITLTPIAAKIYNLMLLNRIRPVIDPILRKNQNGFRTNRSTSGQILTIRRILEGVKAKKLPITLLFIDFAKAFDSIDRLKMENILIIYGIPKDIVNAIMMLYRNTSAMVRSPDGDTPYFEITTGVLQGDTLAPYLFIICLDYILKHSIDDNINLGFTLSQRRSSRHPAIHITDIDYADDIAVTADTIKDAEKMLHQIEEAAEDIGLKINSDKTEYMSLNSKSDNMISRNGNSIKNVDNFKYLGSYIANTENDINTRIAKAWAALNSMIILWKSNLSENLKRSFFRAAVESVLVYGATTWTLTATLEKRLDGAYTRMLRAALNKSWKDHISNKDLYLEIPRISASIRKQRLRFAGHCWRSKDELASDVLLWQPTHSKRPRGRPAKTYIDQLLEDTGCNIDEIPTAMNDRKGWMERVKKCRASSTW